MFASVALVFEQDMRKAPAIRQSMSPRLSVQFGSRVLTHLALAVVAEAIRRDAETWSDVILGYERIFPLLVHASI
jgi:hypothetical protein